MDPESMKRQAAEAALEYVRRDEILGVGSGSTVEHFIRALAIADLRPRAAVAASERSRTLLEAHGVTVVGLAEENVPLGVYVDGADEVDRHLRLIKGGGGALTREKVIASASRQFICIVDESKLVAGLGAFPLAVEVVPMALYAVEHEIRHLGGSPKLRAEYETDNGNVIIDVSGLNMADPLLMERFIDSLPGVVECGIFARRPADVVLVGTESGVRRLARSGTLDGDDVNDG